jgi:thioredoxin-like negative regulator of GroEL
VTGLLFAVATLVLAGVLGFIWQTRQGRVRPSAGAGRGDAPQRTSGAGAGDAASADAPAANTLPDPVLRQVDHAAAVTLLQLTTPICARCPQARAVLGELTTTTEGVQHAELDLADHPDLAGRLGVRSTPTTLAISRAGRELFRVTGVPRRTELLSALQPHL